MSPEFLIAQAHEILQQRIGMAEKARMMRQINTLRRARKRLTRAMTSGLRRGVTADDIVNELTRISYFHDVVQAK